MPSQSVYSGAMAESFQNHFQKHLERFWRSGPENLYTYLWWFVFTALFGAVVMAILALWHFFFAFLVSAVLAWVGAALTKRYGLTLPDITHFNDTAPSPSDSVVAALSRNEAFQMVRIPSPENTKDSFLVLFSTQGRTTAEIATGKKPRALRFVLPTKQTIRESDLPAEVPVGKGRLVIKRFTENGFTFEESETIGDEVRTEVYFNGKSN